MSQCDLRSSPVHDALDSYIREWHKVDPSIVERAGKPVQLELPLQEPTPNEPTR